jgi:hypothetical protein
MGNKEQAVKDMEFGINLDPALEENVRSYLEEAKKK